MIHLKCPNCSATFTVPDSALGKRGQCKKCGARIHVAPTNELSEIDVLQFLAAGDPNSTPRATASTVPSLVDAFANKDQSSDECERSSNQVPVESSARTDIQIPSTTAQTRNNCTIENQDKSSEPEGYRLQEMVGEDNADPIVLQNVDSTKCPSCGAKMAPQAILCILCGHDMRTGKNITPNVGGTDGSRQITPPKRETHNDSPYEQFCETCQRQVTPEYNTPWWGTMLLGPLLDAYFGGVIFGIRCPYCKNRLRRKGGILGE